MEINLKVLGKPSHSQDVQFSPQAFWQMLKQLTVMYIFGYTYANYAHNFSVFISTYYVFVVVLATDYERSIYAKVKWIRARSCVKKKETITEEVGKKFAVFF